MGYITFTIPKKSGGVRIISAPDENLKARQRRLLRELQEHLWISRRAHGFAKRRNILTNAKAHVGKKWILNLDIRDFFPSINLAGIWGIKHTGREIASYLRGGGSPLFGPPELTFHNLALPQGAPTSPFLSNYRMREFDTQIVGLLRKLVSDDIEYTRYADDMTFSSNSRAIERVVGIVESKLRSKRMELNEDKTRLMGRGQRQEITGLNINSGRPTVPKKYRRTVRALVHRAANGWVITHKQKESLMGKISHIALCHPEEARKYRERLLPVTAVNGNTRRLAGAKRVQMKTKRLRAGTPETAQQSAIYNRQSAGCRRIRRLEDSNGL